MEPESAEPRVAERCDICRAERISVREGETYLCEVCLDLEERRIRDPRPDDGFKNGLVI